MSYNRFLDIKLCEFRKKIKHIQCMTNSKFFSMLKISVESTHRLENINNVVKLK